MKPLISIIIPIYNVEKYLKYCLDSVVNQEGDNFEIILVDDGSTDSCSKICDSYKEKNKKIKVIHKANGGLVSARKAGARIAEGEYIACVDGDDWIEENYIKTITKTIINNNKPDIICFNYYECINNTKKINDLFINREYTRKDIVNDIFPYLIQSENMKNFSYAIWNKIFKKSLYLDIQLDVNEEIKIGEDGACVIPCIYNSNSLVTIQDALYNYRINDNAMTKGHKVFDLYGPKRIIDDITKYIDINSAVFKEQIPRFIVHQFFIVASSQFNNKKPYKYNKEQIIKALNQEDYGILVKYARIKGNFKGWFIKMILKYHIIFPLYLYSML